MRQDVLELEKVLSRQEDLHPDLQPYVAEGEDWLALRHPVMYSVPYIPSFNALINQQYIFKKQHVQEAFDEGSWNRYIFLHERPAR